MTLPSWPTLPVSVRPPLTRPSLNRLTLDPQTNLSNPQQQPAFGVPTLSEYREFLHRIYRIRNTSSCRPRFMNMFLSTWALLVTGLIFVLPMLYLRVRNTTVLEEETLYVSRRLSVSPSTH
jgi:hypothetical protein